MIFLSIESRVNVNVASEDTRRREYKYFAAPYAACIMPHALCIVRCALCVVHCAFTSPFNLMT